MCRVKMSDDEYDLQSDPYTSLEYQNLEPPDTIEQVQGQILESQSSTEQDFDSMTTQLDNRNRRNDISVLDNQQQPRVRTT